MCGILVRAGRQLNSFHHRQMRSLRKRGPDEIGYWVDSSVQMAHARLSIIGLDERGVEPLESSTHVLAYNGEIYNFLEIRDRIEQAGMRVEANNDASVLLHAWQLWGRDLLKDLVGFWAFVIYDKAAQTLTLVRDQFGVKPLYYRHVEGDFCVASLLKTILEVTPGENDLDLEALSEYVRYQFTFGDKTFFKQIRKVPPGHLVEYDLRSGKLTSSCYEDIFSANSENWLKPDGTWMQDAEQLMRQCILESTISDTSFTTFCSGGVDSSLITRIAEPDVAYHCNYSDPECNETFFAKQVVEGSKTRLFVVNAAEEFDLVSRIRDIVEDFDEPTIGSVILPLEDLLSQVKRRYKVILTGTGGDELFAGYVRYQLALGECYQDSYRALYTRMKALTSVTRRFEMTHTKGDVSMFKFYDPKVEQTFLDAFGACHTDGDDLSAMLRFDRKYFLAGLLNIDDKMCGRHSLESRPSLLHQKFVRHIQRLNPASLLLNGELKPILRRLGGNILPKSVAHRQDKMGFTTPVGDFVNRSADHIREQIHNSPFRDMYELPKMNLRAENKFAREVFGLLMLDVWLNRYAKSAPHALAAHP